MHVRGYAQHDCTKQVVQRARAACHIETTQRADHAQPAPSAQRPSDAFVLLDLYPAVVYVFAARSISSLIVHTWSVSQGTVNLSSGDLISECICDYARTEQYAARDGESVP